MPALEPDNGSHLSEVTAICEYLEDKHPEPPLIGSAPGEKAECRVWTRRVDLEHLANRYRFGEGNDFFKSRILTAPEASPGLKAIAQNRLNWLDGQMVDGREYLCGKRFTLADSVLYRFVTFFAKVGQLTETANKNIGASIERVGGRPSMKARSRLIEIQAALQRASGASMTRHSFSSEGRCRCLRNHRRATA